MTHQVVLGFGQSSQSVPCRQVDTAAAARPCLGGSRQGIAHRYYLLTQPLAASLSSWVAREVMAGGRTVRRVGWYSIVVAMPLLLLSACGPHDCWDIRGCHSSYLEYPSYPVPTSSYAPGLPYNEIPMGSGTIMQGGRATGYYSTFGNQTTIIQPGQAPIYIDGY